MSSILEIKNLNYKYEKNTIFNNFSLKVEEGSYIAIAGSNASGKTTLIKLIAGIIPNKNKITIGYSYVERNNIKEHITELGVVFGNFLNTFLFEDVYKEMAFSLENLNWNPKEIEKRILEVAKLFNISRLLDKKTKDLTSSEKQEVQLAISLLHMPRILLLDNAFSMMDKNTKIKIRKALKEYHSKYKLTIIVTTTNLEDILDADYLYILHKGNIVMEGEPFVVFQEDRLLNRLGLSLPFMVDLSLKLEFYELLTDIEIDMNRMVDNLWK